MKLLISLSYYSPHISGLTLALRHLAELLQKNGFQVTVLAAQHEKSLSREEKINDVSVVRVPYLFRLSKGFFMPIFIGKAYAAVKNTDAVLIALPQPEGLLVALLAKMLRRKIYCLYICEVELQGGKTAKIIESVLRIINKMTLSFADDIITLTDDFARNNRILKNIERNVIGIYPFVIPPQISKKEQDTLQKRLPSKKYYIGYLGRIASEKGIEYLLETIPILQKEFGNYFSIVLAGPKETIGEKHYKQKIDIRLKEYSEYITQLGELSDEQLGAFYSLLDVFVLPSVNNTEVFGMVQVEAMYCGTPVVTTDIPGVRVPIEKTDMGEIVSPGDSHALAEAIMKVLKNKQKYSKDRKLIEDIFSEEKILKAYQHLFTS